MTPAATEQLSRQIVAFVQALRGLVAALPFIDDFLPAHNLASLEDLASSRTAAAAPSASQPPRHGSNTPLTLG